MQRKPLIWIAALALAAVLGLSAQASASTVKGTVVHANKSAHTMVVAGRGGRLTSVSSRHFARAGSKVRVSGRKLKNGSVRAHRLRVRGHARHARLRGLVTWSNTRGFTVAAHGASLLVHRSSSSDPAPLGAPVSTNVTIDDHGDLDENECHQVGDMPGQMKIEGVVLSTDTTAQTITISGDDDQEDMTPGADMSDDHGDNSGDDNEGEDVQPAIVVHVPDATAFTVGDKVELVVTGPAADGSFTLVSVDEDNPAGEDHHGDQGDNSGDQGDNSGPGGSGDGGSDDGGSGSDG
jgi:uncharacterized membrane protein YgcG